MDFTNVPAIQLLLSQALKKKIKIINSTKLNHKKDVSVIRVVFTSDNSGEKSVIVKYDQQYEAISGQHEAAHIHPALQNELCGYRFLMSLRQEFNFFPRLIEMENNALVLEDLGEDRLDFPDEESAQKALLSTFANLHAAGSGKSSVYAGIKKAQGICQSGFSLLSYYDQAHHFSIGVCYCQTFLNLLAIKMPGFEEVINRVEGVMSRPGRLKTFIHNDFASRRQSVIRQGKFYLLDFEHSKMGHALIDFWRLYVGKIEYNRAKGYYFRKRIPFIKGMDQWYCQQFENFYRKKMPLKQWQDHFSSTLVYSTFALIGMLLQLPRYLKQLGLTLNPATPFPEEVKALLLFMLLILEDKKCYPKLCRICRQWLDKMNKIDTLYNGGNIQDHMETANFLRSRPVASNAQY